MLLATGLNKGRELNIPGAHLAGVYNGIDFLINVNLGFEIELGKRVAVVGGGNVAIDVARAAVRLVHEAVDSGAADEDAESLQPALDAARMAMRSGAEASVPGQPGIARADARVESEVEEAEHEGIAVDNGWGPKEIVGENGVVTGLKVRRCVSVFDENGRFNPAFSDEEKVIPCDSVVLAIGQQADLSFLGGDEGVQVTPRGILKIDENLMTTAPGVFAGGDVAFGPRVLVEAVANGHRAARSIHVYLSGKTEKTVLSRFRIFDELGDAARLPDHSAADRCRCCPPIAASGSPKWNWDSMRSKVARKGCAASSARSTRFSTARSAFCARDAWMSVRRIACVWSTWCRCSGDARYDALIRNRYGVPAARTASGPGRRHHQERRKVHSLRTLRPAVSHRRHHHGSAGAAREGSLRIGAHA